MVLGPIDLSAALDATLSYWARRTSSYSADSLFVRAGTDGATFESLLFGGGLPTSASTWEEILVTIPISLKNGHQWVGNAVTSITRPLRKFCFQ